MTDSQSGPSAKGDRASRPLSGKRVLITRSPARAEGVVRALEGLGAEAVVAATTTIVDVVGPARSALLAALLAGSKFDWILFTSANGVRACQRILLESDRDCQVLAGARIAAMGEATAAALLDCGLRADLQAISGSSEDLARQLLASASPGTPSILFPRAQGGRDEAIALLRAAGCELQLHEAYASETVAANDPALADALAQLSGDKLDGVVFFAPSQLHALLERSPESMKALSSLAVIAAIGATTAEALAEVGLQANAVADEPTTKDIVDKILQAFS